MTKSDATQASKNFNYQEDVNAKLNREHDLNATAPDDEMANEDITMEGLEAANYVKAAVQKVLHSSSFLIHFLLYICNLATKNCLFSALNSSASRELGQTDPDRKHRQHRSSTKPHPYP
jgi:hypothetical protein